MFIANGVAPMVASRTSDGIPRLAGGRDPRGFHWLGLFTLIVLMGCGGESAPSNPKESSLKPEIRQVPERASGLPAQLTATSPQPVKDVTGEDNPALADPAIDLGELLKPSTENPLIGSWLGAATLDTGLLSQKLERVDEVERVRLRKVAEIFLTYQVAMDFYNDGRLSMVVQFVLDGQEQLVSATGTWKLIQRDQESAIVELVEQIEGKAPNTSQVRIMIHPDGQQIARPAELDEQLAVCEPMFIFNRIPEDFLQQVDVANQSGTPAIR